MWQLLHIGVVLCQSDKNEIILIVYNFWSFESRSFRACSLMSSIVWNFPRAFSSSFSNFSAMFRRGPCGPPMRPKRHIKMKCWFMPRDTSHVFYFVPRGTPMYVFPPRRKWLMTSFQLPNLDFFFPTHTTLFAIIFTTCLFNEKIYTFHTYIIYFVCVCVCVKNSDKFHIKLPTFVNVLKIFKCALNILCFWTFVCGWAGGLVTRRWNGYFNFYVCLELMSLSTRIETNIFQKNVNENIQTYFMLQMHEKNRIHSKQSGEFYQNTYVDSITYVFLFNISVFDAIHTKYQHMKFFDREKFCRFFIENNTSAILLK